MKKIFFVGIKGVGLAGLALVAKQSGYTVAGSDTDEEFITDKFLCSEGIKIHSGFEINDIDKFFETKDEENVVVTTAAHGGYENKQVQFALKRGIKILNYGQALGEFMSGRLLPKKQIGISVSGSHGKTTISALVASTLTLLNFDPSYVVGTGEIFPIGAAGHYGSGDFFVAEADEYFSEIKHDRRSKFIYQKPHYTIINNIDFDHPDVFRSIDDVEQSFLSFVSGMPKNGTIIVNGDDEHVQSVLKKLNVKLHIVTYGEKKTNDYYLFDFQQSGLSSKFMVNSKSFGMSEFSLSIPGYHNAKNSLSVIALLFQLGIPVAKIQEVLPKFLGTKRRFEFVGKTKNGMIIVDDYAHHPAEIQATLLAAKEAFPTKKLICLFQPHTFSRTHALLSEFASAFTHADSVVLLPTFASARETEIKHEFRENKMYEKLKKIRSGILSLEKFDVIEYVQSHFNDDKSVLITMGAGDVYKIGKQLLV